MFIVADRVRDRSELDDFEEKIMHEFKENPPATLREAQSRIEMMTGLKRSLHRLGVWLKKKGLRSLVQQNANTPTRTSDKKR